MSTKSADHKFAVLFSGSTDQQHLDNLQKVYDALTQFCNYQTGNIKVVIGSHDAGWTDPGFTLTYEVVSDASAFMQSYYNFVSRSTPGHDPEEQAKDEENNDDWNTLVFYITAKIDETAGQKLVLREADPNDGADSDVLLPMMGGEPNLAFTVLGMDGFPQTNTSTYHQYTSIHIVLQTDKAHGFRDNLYNGILGTKCVSFTFATDDNTTDATGNFTEDWTNGLKMIQNGGGLYADQINTGGGEPDDNLLISTRKLCQYVHGTLSDRFDEKFAPGLTNPDDFMIGKPKFRIRDGDELPAPDTRGWWASPDIWIINANHDQYDNHYYMYDSPNDIHTRVYIEGTHPVRLIYFGVKVFKSGGGGPGERHTASHDPGAILKNGDSTEYVFNYDYAAVGETHSCIKSRAAIIEIEDEDIDDDPSNEWNPHGRDYEAQRNTDPSPLKSSGGGAGAGDAGGAEEEIDTGDAKVDEEAPEEDAKAETDDPETDTDTKTTRNLRDAKEHEYVVKNTFRKPRDFRFMIDPLLFERDKEFFYKWWKKDPRAPERLVQLQPVSGAHPYIGFQLRPGEEVTLVSHIGIRRKAEIGEGVNLDFAIEMGTRRFRRFLFWRFPSLGKMKFRRFSGVTLEITSASFTMTGLVKTRDGQPLPETVVIAKTLNGRQSAAALTDKSGQWAFKEINPDIYRVFAIYKKKSSKEVIVHGMPVRKKPEMKPIEIIVDG